MFIWSLSSNMVKVNGFMTWMGKVKSKKMDGALVAALIGCHCFAYCLSLGLGHTIKKVPYLKDIYQNGLQGLHGHFRRSTLEMDSLKKMQTTMNLRECAIMRLCLTRWLSLDSAVDSQAKNLPAEIKVIKRSRDTQTEKIKKAKLTLLYEEISAFKFAASTHFLNDAMRGLNLFSLKLQNSNLTLIQVKNAYTVALLEVDHQTLFYKNLLDSTVPAADISTDTCREIIRFTNDLMNRMSNYYDCLADVPEGSERSKVLPDKFEDFVRSVALPFLHILTAELKYYFEESASCKLLAALEVFLNTPNRADCEVVEIEEAKKYLVKENIFTEVFCIDVNNEREVWNRYWDNIEGDVPMSAGMLCEQMGHTGMSELKKLFPNMMTLVETIAVTPLSSVEAERGFSLAKLILKPERYIMWIAHLK